MRPGSPFVYGGFTSNVDMKSGAPAFGTPEYMKAALVGGQLARRYGLPYRSSNTNAANTLDAQAAYESVFSLWGAMMGGVNLLMHGAGWMEGGLHASLREDGARRRPARHGRRIPDAPSPVDDDELALDAMREVGPGGHFFGCAHTQARYRTAFFAPMISDWRNYETWREAGSPTAYDTANRLYKAAARRLSRSRRSIRRSARSSKPSSPAARPRAARRRIFEAVSEVAIGTPDPSLAPLADAANRPLDRHREQAGQGIQSFEILQRGSIHENPRAKSSSSAAASSAARCSTT